MPSLVKKQRDPPLGVAVCVKSPPAVAGFLSDRTSAQFEVSACLVEHVRGFSADAEGERRGGRGGGETKGAEKLRGRRSCDREKLEFRVRGGVVKTREGPDEGTPRRGADTRPGQQT